MDDQNSAKFGGFKPKLATSIPPPKFYTIYSLQIANTHLSNLQSQPLILWKQKRSSSQWLTKWPIIRRKTERKPVLIFGFLTLYAFFLLIYFFEKKLRIFFKYFLINFTAGECFSDKFEACRKICQKCIGINCVMKTFYKPSELMSLFY